MNKKNLLYEEIYTKTQNCGRAQFVKLLQKHQIKIEQLQQENTDLKQMINFPSVTITTCPKCGKKYSINYCKEVYELEKENKELHNILNEFEKWLEKELFDKTQIHFQYSLALKKCLDKLQELKEVRNNEC